MFYVEVFLLLIFTVLCAIMLTLWRIRDQLERLADTRAGGTTPSVSASSSSAKPPAA